METNPEVMQVSNPAPTNILNKEFMNARDLRIGNIVFDKSRSEHDFEKLGNGIYRVSAHAIERFDAGFMDLKPVHLTSEWLERFGATEEKEGKRFRLKNRLIVVRMGFFVDYGSDVVLKTVHQTQNFIFAITGSEIQIKDNTV